MVTSREPSSRSSILMMWRLPGKMFSMELPHSTTVMVLFELMDSSRSSAMRPGSDKR